MYFESLADGQEFDWPVEESIEEYETGWYTGGFDRVTQPDGTIKRYYWASLPPSVVIVASTGESVIFVEQYRPTIRERHLELPAGIVEDGESYSQAAARELREETGFDPAVLVVLQEMWVATGVLRHKRAIVFAEGLEPVDRNLDENEFITVTPVPTADVLEVAREQPANDATLEGVLLATVDGLL